MLRRSFRVGWKVGILFGLSFTVLKVMQARRRESAQPTSPDWNRPRPSNPTPAPTPSVLRSTAPVATESTAATSATAPTAPRPEPTRDTGRGNAPSAQGTGISAGQAPKKAAKKATATKATAKKVAAPAKKAAKKTAEPVKKAAKKAAEAPKKSVAKAVEAAKKAAPKPRPTDS